MVQLRAGEHFFPVSITVLDQDGMEVGWVGLGGLGCACVCVTFGGHGRTGLAAIRRQPGVTRGYPARPHRPAPLAPQFLFGLDNLKRHQVRPRRRASLPPSLASPLGGPRRCWPAPPDARPSILPLPCLPCLPHPLPQPT